jgi:hypothetical protein
MHNVRSLSVSLPLDCPDDIFPRSGSCPVSLYLQQFRGGFYRLVISLIKRFIAPPAPRNHAPGPEKVFPLPLHRPAGGWVMDDIPDIADLVRNPELLCPSRGMGSMLYLELFTNILPQRLVIRDLAHDSGDRFAELLFQLREGCFRIFNRIVQYRRQQQRFIRHAALFCQDRCDCNGVVYVRGSVYPLATLVFMFFRGKCHRPEQSDMSVQIVVS